MVTGTSVGTSFSSTSSASSNPVGSAPAAPGHRQRSKIWRETNGATMLLLMVANRQTHQLRFAVASHHLQGFIHLRWLFGISSINGLCTGFGSGNWQFTWDLWDLQSPKCAPAFPCSKMETEGNLERAMCFRVSEKSQPIFRQKLIEASHKNFMKTQWICWRLHLFVCFLPVAPPPTAR